MMASQLPIIELDGVSFRRGESDIVSSVSWKILPHSRWAILGPNGSGKSTLLKIACGYLWPTGGVVRRLGAELVDLRTLRRSIGWVTNEVTAEIPKTESVIKTVVSGRYAMLGLYGGGDTQPVSTDFQEAEEVLASMGCSGLAQKQFGILSQGERQQALIARARMADPMLIVLDEPCAGMDPGNRERFLGWLNRFASASNGPAVILVTHHVEEIMPCFSSTLILKNGRMVAAGPTSEIISQSVIEELYQTRIVRLDHSHDRLWPIWMPGA